MHTSRLMLLKDQLPSAIRALHKMQLLSYQSTATVVSSVLWKIEVYLFGLFTKAGLFAAAEAQLLTYVKSRPITCGVHTKRALLFFSYASLLLSSSAAVSSFILTRRVAGLPSPVAPRELPALEPRIIASQDTLHKYRYRPITSMLIKYVLSPHCE
jgi:hypothetical protein